MGSRIVSDLQENNQGSIDIMIVDDNEDLVLVLSEALSDAGFEVATAKDGMDALYKIKRLRPKLVLTDIVMPDMDGLELIRALRKLSVKILAMTAEKRHMNAARDFGAEHVFDKPLEAESVIEYVKTTIEAA